MSDPHDRAAQLEMVARQMYEQYCANAGHLIFEFSTLGSYQQLTWKGQAEIALSLAEATRDDIAKWHDEQEKASSAQAELARANKDYRDALHHNHIAADHSMSAAAIRATPILIGDAGTGRVR